MEAQRHEALLNLAFASVASDFELMCPYDTETLPPDVLDAARHTHPYVGHDDDCLPSATYPGEDALNEFFTAPLPPPPPGVEELAFTADSLNELRCLVASTAGDQGPRRARWCKSDRAVPLTI